MEGVTDVGLSTFASVAVSAEISLRSSSNDLSDFEVGDFGSDHGDFSNNFVSGANRVVNVVSPFGSGVQTIGLAESGVEDFNSNIVFLDLREFERILNKGRIFVCLDPSYGISFF